MSSKVTVTTTALHLIDVPKNPAPLAAMSAIMAKADIPSLIFQKSMGTLASKMKNLFHYAENEYALELPSGKTTTINEPTSQEIMDALALDISYPLGVIALDWKYQGYDAYFEVLDHLIINRAFNLFTNRGYAYSGLDFSNGQELRLIWSDFTTDRLSVILSYQYWGYTEATFYDGGDQGSYTAVVFAHLSTHEETIARPDTTDMMLNDNCLLVKYQKLDAQGAVIPGVYYWTYRTYTNLYPELNNQINAGLTDKYLPVVPIRYNNDDMTHVSKSNTDLFKTSKRLLKFVDLPFEKLGDKINASPDIASIDNAYVMFGADVQSNEPTTLAYLNHYFDYLGSLNTTSYGSSVSSLFGQTHVPAVSLTEHGLSVSIAFSAIETTYIPGKIDSGKIGNARKTITTDNYWVDVGSGENVTSEMMTTTCLVLDYQFTKSMIRRVKVFDLATNNYVRSKYVISTGLVEVATDPNNHNMIIPLEFNMTLLIPHRQRTALYADCTLLVITTYDKRKLKWYEESWFAAIVIIVVFVIAVWTCQYWIIGAIGALEGGLIAMLIYIAIQLTVAVTISIVANWIIREYGTQIGIIGAVIVGIIAIAASRGAGGFQILAQYTLSYAQLALQLSMAVISSANETIQNEIKKLTSEYEAFTNLIKEAEKALETNTEVQKLSFKSDLDLFAVKKIQEYLAVPNEYPTAFFERTLELPYATTYGIHKAIPTFVDNLIRVDNQTVALAF